MKLLLKMHEELNDKFREDLKGVVQEEFGIEVESSWNIIAMRLITTRVDGRKFTKAQYDFMDTWEKGFLAAKERVFNRYMEMARKE